MQPHGKKARSVARLSGRLDRDSRCMRVILQSQLSTETAGYRMAATWVESSCSVWVRHGKGWLRKELEVSKKSR